MSYFDYERIAEGYAKSRPQYHTIVMEMLRKKMNIEGMLENGLDLGCGAGLSASALLKVCNHVIGADASKSMIERANKEKTSQEIEYIECPAEKLDFPQNFFDIITIAGAINWIDETVFLPLAGDILKKNGIMVIYDNFMSDKMDGNVSYTDWWHEEYLKKFPKPARKENLWSDKEVSPYHFIMEGQERYSNRLEMTKDEYIAYMLTQSNVIARVEQGGENLEEVRKWFENTLDKVFCNQKQTLVFEGYIWYLKRNDY